jgi:hypothetical protein
MAEIEKQQQLFDSMSMKSLAVAHRAYRRAKSWLQCLNHRKLTAAYIVSSVTVLYLTQQRISNLGSNQKVGL